MNLPPVTILLGLVYAVSRKESPAIYSTHGRFAWKKEVIPRIIGLYIHREDDRNEKKHVCINHFLIVGLITGIIIGQLLAPVPALAFLTKSVQISWEPKADLQVVKYEFHLLVKLNLCSIIGLVGAYLLYRKL